MSKPHAYLQTMVKTSAKFQEDRYKTLGGVAHTRYPLSSGDRTPEPRKGKNYVPPLFFEKAGDNK